MPKSLVKELHFRNGEQYELNEFNLKSIESTFNNGLEYENYEYIKDDITTFLGIKISANIILQYNADILCGVIYKLDLNNLESLVWNLNQYLPTANQINIRNVHLGKTFTVISFKEYTVKLDIAKEVRITIIKNLG